MYTRDLDELELVGVYDRGVANQERIVIRPRIPINMVNCCVMLGLEQSPGLAIPYNNYVFWFGNTIIEPPSWIFLYTGTGEPRLTTTSGTNEPAYVVHWGLSTTVFDNERIVPMIFQVDAVKVGISNTKLLAGQTP